jgi:hypothetical protein
MWFFVLGLMIIICRLTYLNYVLEQKLHVKRGLETIIKKVKDKTEKKN